MCVKFISVVVLYCWLHLSVAAPDGKYKSDAENLNTDKADIAFPDDLDIRKFPKQNLMFHHHHHHPDFHHHHHPDFHPFYEESDESEEEISDEMFWGQESRNVSMQVPVIDIF